MELPAVPFYSVFRNGFHTVKYSKHNGGDKVEVMKFPGTKKGRARAGLRYIKIKCS